MKRYTQYLAETGLEGPLYFPEAYIPGTPGDDTLVGTDGWDTLDGGEGADHMTGGKGFDVYIVDNVGDVVVELSNGSFEDAVHSSISYKLGDYVETLVLTGDADLTGTGNSLRNWMTGNSGNNKLDGKNGADEIDGGAGNDTLVGGKGEDDLLGGDGDDVLTEEEGSANGEGGNDTVKGAEYLYGGDGNDKLIATASASLGGGNGKDKLTGSAEDDYLDGGAGIDRVYGGAGNDRLGDQYDEADTLDGGEGDDTVNGSWTQFAEPLVWHHDGSTVDIRNNKLISIESLWLQLGVGNDVISNTAGNDWIAGGEGDDSISTGSGNDQLFGSVGNDTLEGGEGLSTLQGEAGNDLLIGGSAFDTTYGGADTDTVYAGAGDDRLLEYDTVANVLDGGDGVDFLHRSYAHLSSDISFDSHIAGAQVVGLDTISGIETFVVDLGSGDDHFDLSAHAYYDKIWGHDGNDLLNAGGGEGWVYGGEGNDTVMGQGHGALYGDNGDDLVDARGGAAPALYGGAGNDTVFGSDGFDYMYGESGSDVLIGGAGYDRVDGGGGSDVFVFDSTVDYDTIVNFVSGSDSFRFAQATLTIGDGDTVVDGATTIAAPGGYSSSAELVIATSNVAGSHSAAKAAAAIGSATAAFSLGQTALFVVDNGVETAIYRFESQGTDADVNVLELSLIATVAASSTVTGDYFFGA